jgi:hypothetical protein
MEFDHFKKPKMTIRYPFSTDRMLFLMSFTSPDPQAAPKIPQTRNLGGREVLIGWEIGLLRVLSWLLPPFPGFEMGEGGG